MADSEKTEKASARKRGKSREEGNVLKSTEVNTVFCSAVIFSAMLIMLPGFIRKLADVVVSYFGGGSLILSTEQITPAVMTGILANAVRQLAIVAAPILGAALIAGVFINLVQVGFLFTGKAIRPKFSRISPIQGFKRIFSVRTLTELAKSLMKVVVCGVIAYGDYKKIINDWPLFMGLPLYGAFLESLRTAFTIALKCCVALVFVAGADFLFQWWKREKDMMMTKEEVKEEYKQTEGNPQTKSRIRSKQRQISAMRMMQNVPGADVVITNPTHFAVALKYEDGKNAAPEIVAKGADFLAQKIKDTARENNVTIVENPPLARSLYSMCEVGDVIPEELYQAVADVLAFVIRQKQTRR
ncbi:MAG: flagellar biosynthesis protein FlhB [Oscillospiraceae bacterium]|jgi:flagellar biosynthetic protein FlhB|nr:flagellar biosynthesis protein FlhB [Oscillospiraceae bacterium]